MLTHEARLRFRHEVRRVITEHRAEGVHPDVIRQQVSQRFSYQLDRPFLHFDLWEKEVLRSDVVETLDRCLMSRSHAPA